MCRSPCGPRSGAPGTCREPLGARAYAPRAGPAGRRARPSSRAGPDAGRDQRRAAPREPGVDGARAGRPERHGPLLAPLPRTRPCRAAAVDVVDVEPDQLGHPEPAGVEQLEDGAVAQPAGDPSSAPTAATSISAGPRRRAAPRAARGWPWGSPGAGPGPGWRVRCARPTRERPGRRAAAGSAGAAPPRGRLRAEPAPQQPDVQIVELGGALPRRRREQRGDVAAIGAHACGASGPRA